MNQAAVTGLSERKESPLWDQDLPDWPLPLIWLGSATR
jgi:hypothetical protein